MNGMKLVILTLILTTFFHRNICAQCKSDSVKSKILLQNQLIELKGLSATTYFTKLTLMDSTNCNDVITIVGESPDNWITKNDVQYLIKFINSSQQIGCLNKIQSSHWPTECSTLGGQAMDLIDSFRFKVKYFDGLYSCTKTDISRASEIMKWWQEYTK